MDLNRYRLREHVNGEDEAKQILLANEDSFNSFKRTSNHTNAHPASEERMGLDTARPIKRFLNRLNLLIRNHCDFFAAIENRVYSRRCHDLQSAIKAAANEEVA
ncbi:MAG: hypothetical protein ABSE36_11205, partial [Terracidiphilus sp.]